MQHQAGPVVSSICSYSVVLLLLMLRLHGAGAGAATPCYPAIFLFGDSLSDTGNGPITGNAFFLRTTMRPYGETYPGTPTGRFSDGRLIIDFLATALGLPFLNPSLNSSADFSRGINYAVAGATALNTTFLATKLVFPLTNDSLEVQLRWHLAFKASIPPGGAPGKPDPSAFGTGLYVLEIGGNDYSGAFQTGYTPAYVNTTFVPLVIQKIRDVTEILYTGGARKFLYISITPLGCSPSYLATYGLLLPKNSDGCLSDYNSVAYNHGASLLNAVQSLRAAHPDAQFLLADYYGAYTYILEHKATFGFSDTLDACCGAPPPVPNRYSIATFCNNLSSTFLLTLCSNPNVYLNWDGIHLTDKFNLAVTNQFISGSYLNPSNGLSSCASHVSG